jgi:long-subunit fatty acid transport protein
MMAPFARSSATMVESPGGASTANATSLPPVERMSFDPGVRSAALPQRAAMPMHWSDTWSLRAGGDYNVVPGRLALRAGVSYATRAVPVEYMSIVAWPLQKVGLHLGATVAFGRFRTTLAYAHLFFRSIQVPLGAGQVKESVQVRPEQANAVNEGSYRAALDVFSTQLDFTF